MGNLVERIAQIGLEDDINIIERRRITMLNFFSTLIILVIILLSLVNVATESFFHAFIIFSSSIVLMPVYYFNYTHQHQLSRYYFVTVTLLIINLLGYNSVFNFDNRYNEIYFITFSSIIVILLDNPQKLAFFMLSIGFAIVMYMVRWDHLGLGFTKNSFIIIVNTIIIFMVIYIATSLFKNDLIKSLKKVQQYSNKLEEQQALVLAKQTDLTASRRLLRKLIDELPILIAMMDLEGNYLIVNRKYQEVFNLEINEIEGKNSKEILGEELYNKRMPLFQRCLEGKESILNYSIKLPSGKVMESYGKYLPMFDEDKLVTGVLVYVTDVSMLREAEEKLRELNRTKDKLLSIISHDLKAPMNSLKGLIQHIDSIETNDLKRFMADIQGQIDTVSFTLDNLLSWVHTQLKGFIAVPEDVNLFEVIQQAIVLYEPQVILKNVEIKYKNDNIGTVYADKENISLVCRNLISNALKFTPQNGVITISCESKEDSTIMCVSDDGIGMSEEHIDTIMNDTKRNISRKGTEGETGTGLGLTFCKDILKLNNAFMEIFSEENRGTEVKVTFQKVDDLKT